ncbi:MAG: hypothetical protein ACAI38_02220 [Myxococcota bacterium]|nr:hypothetical protein [Myxococcota bacterium]
MTSAVDELIADPQAQLEAQRLEQPTKQPGTSKSDAIVAKDAGGPAASARDIVAERLENPLNAAQLMNVKQPLPGGSIPRVIIENEIARMSADGFSETSQRDFIKEVKKLAKLKSLTGLPTKIKRQELSSEQKQDLAWIAQVVRDSTSHKPRLNLGELSEFFGDHGLRLQWSDKHDSEKHFSSLDRGAFRSRLKVILEDVAHNGGKMTKHQLDSLLGMLEQVTDVADMKHARWMIDARVMAGQLEIPESIEIPGRRPGEPSRTVHLRERFDAFMAERLRDSIDVRQLGWEARALRKAIQAAHDPTKSGDGIDREDLLAAVDEARERFMQSVEIAAADKNPDLLHYARRALDRELGRKCHNDAGHVCRRELLASIDARMGDRSDRYSRRREIEALVAEGKLTEKEAFVAHVGVTVTTTNTEYRQILPRFDDLLGLQISSIVLAAMAQTNKLISENIGGGDAERVREEQQRLRQADARLREQRLFDARIFEEGQRLRHHSERVDRASTDLQRAQTSAIVVKRTDIRVEGTRRDQQHRTVYRTAKRERVVEVLFLSRQSRLFGAQTARTGAFASLTTAKTPEQVSRALGQVNMFAGEAAKNSGPAR